MFYAHIRSSEHGPVNQSAQQHCRNTAVYADRCLQGVGLARAGFLAGLVHDCGKFKAEFQQYLNDPDGVRGSVNHTFAGCRLLLERYHTPERDPVEWLTAELLAYAAGAHHGLFDCVDEQQKSGFLHRLTKEQIFYSESVQNFLQKYQPSIPFWSGRNRRKPSF